MAVDLASAYVQIIPSLRGAGSTIQKELGGIGSSSGKFFGGGFLTSFKGALGPLAGIAAGALGIGAVTGFLSDSVNAASDLQQSIGGVDAVFGKSAKQIHEWAAEGSRAVGLSENEYNSLASVIGSQLKNAGNSMAKVGDQTKNLITLGADLSATFGGTATEAVESISSALRGERDPIEKYGVSLTQAAVDAEAARLGFKKLGGTLSTQASQAATLSLIYKQTSAATGQFSAQTNTLAEQQQIFAATMQNVKAKIGTAFLPAITSVVGALSNSLDPALAIIQPKLDSFAGKMEGVGVAITGFFKGLTASPTGAGSVTEPLDKFVTAGQGVRQFIRDSQPAIQTYLGILRSVGPLVGSAFATIGPALGTALAQVGPELAKVIPPLSTAVVKLLPSLVNLILALTPLIPPLAQIIIALSPAVSKLADALVFLIDHGVKPIVDNTAGFVGFFTQITQGGFTAGLAMEGLSGKFGPVVQALGIFGAAVGTIIGTAVRTFRELPGAILKTTGAFGGLLVKSGRALIDGFIRGIKSAVGAVGDAVSGVLNFAKSFFPHSPAKRGPFSGSGWTGLAKSGSALAAQFTGGFNNGVSDFASTMSAIVPDTITSSVAGTINTTGQGGTAVLINNKTNVRIEDLIDVRIARNSDEEATAQRLGYQPLVFG